jgi:hypothetical protein
MNATDIADDSQPRRVTYKGHGKDRPVEDGVSATESVPATDAQVSPISLDKKKERSMADCNHLSTVVDVKPLSTGCEECLSTCGQWVHLRLCMACGHVGCCNDSLGKHASAHWLLNRGHPIIRSFEPGEDWWWCFSDEQYFEVRGAPPSPSHPVGRLGRLGPTQPLPQPLRVSQNSGLGHVGSTGQEWPVAGS